MRNFLEMIYEYQRLRSRELKLDIQLEPAERARLMGLYRMLQGETPDTGLREMQRARVPMPVQFTRPGGFEGGEIRDLGGGGFCIATPRPQEVGTRLVVRVEDASAGVEYVFPCRVVWRAQSGPGRMGVEIDGVPNRADLYGEESGVWQRSVTFGAVRKEPLVA